MLKTKINRKRLLTILLIVALTIFLAILITLPMLPFIMREQPPIYEKVGRVKDVETGFDEDGCFYYIVKFTDGTTFNFYSLRSFTEGRQYYIKFKRSEKNPNIFSVIEMEQWD